MSLATLNGTTALRARAQVPAWGLWWAEVECGGENPIAPGTAATLVVDDLTLKGTIVTGGAYEARTRYRVVAGKGGWGKTIPAKAYANDLGVKFSTILTDAAAACGEQLGVVPAGTVGASFVRPSGPASLVLEELFPRGWYVDENGVTQIGRRPTTTYAGGATRMVDDRAIGRMVLAPPAIASLLPGAVVDGVEAVDVEHVLEGTLRTTIWGARAGRTGDPVVGAIAKHVDHFTASHRFFAPWKYRVVRRVADRLDLQPVRVSSGMPDLRSVRIRAGVSGIRTAPKLGSIVLVSFVNGEPSEPVVTSFDDAESPGFLPDDIYLQAGTAGAQPTEHATSAEALVLFVRNVVVLATSGLGVPAATIDAACATVLGVMAGTPSVGVTASLSAPLKSAILAALTVKTPDASGDAPNIGWPHVRGG